MTSLNYSETESKRFAREIYRGTADVLDIHYLREFYANHEPDTVIFRVPVSEQHKLHVLNTLGKEVIIADTLVYYDLDLNQTIYREIKNTDLSFVTAGKAEKKIFEDLVPKIFHNYTTHYFSNPQLDKVKITEGYTEWAVNRVDSANNLNLLATRNGQAIGFITCTRTADSAEIILNGVLPEYQKGGIYTDLVRYVKQYYHKQNISRLCVSTQIQNFAVQRVWNKEGFVLSSAYITIHLNKNQTRQ